MKTFFLGLGGLFIFLIGGVLLSLASISVFIARGGQKKRFRALFDYASKRGFELPDADLATLLRLNPFAFARAVHQAGKRLEITGLKDISEFKNSTPPSQVVGFNFRIKNQTAILFTHSRSSGPGPNGSRYQLKCAAIANPGIPSLRLEQKTLSQSLATSILKTTDFVHEVEFPDDLRFSQSFVVTVSTDGQKEEVSQFLSVQIRAEFIQNPFPGEIAVGKHFAVYMETGTFSDDISYDDFIDSARKALGPLYLFRKANLKAPF